MAGPISDASLCRRNSKLETFLKRTAQRHVHERIRYYEACVVVSQELDKVFMHVLLTDDSIYLTEFHPRTLHRALHFSHIVNIELINDLPDFLRGKDQEQSLHIRVVHTHAKGVGKHDSGDSGLALTKPQTVASQQDSYGPTCHLEGISRVQQGSDQRTSSPSNRSERNQSLRHAGRPKGHDKDGCKNKRKSKSSVLDRLKKRTGGESEKNTDEEQKKEAELHLYAVMLTSQIYINLQRSWNSYIMRSTLMLRTHAVSKKHKHEISWERTCHLFGQLSGELLQDHLSLESLYLLLQELWTAAHHNPTVRTLFWRSPELYPFLVKTLAESLPLSHDTLHTADRLLLSTLVVQTMSLMFGETEKDAARFSVLTSKQGSETAALLLALVCDPELRPRNADSPPDAELQVLQAEYLDAASVLLFELVMFCQETRRIPNVGHFLTVAWIFQTLQPHAFFLLFMGYQAQCVVLALSCSSESPLSPSQAVLLYQRCHLLLACMPHSACVNSYIVTELKEEFRYYVRQSKRDDKLPPHYPISRPAQHLLSQLLSLLLDKP